MRTIFGLCTPRDGVLKSSAEEADFAADQAQVLRGSAPREYVEPQQARVINALTLCRFFTDQGDELANPRRIFRIRNCRRSRLHQGSQ